MRRLYIIGNGFDLAHGLKTSFSDFILYHFKQIIIDSLENHDTNEYLFLRKNTNRTSDGRELPIIKESLRNSNSIEEILRICSDSSDSLVAKGIYLSIIERKVTESWADVEALYFNLLKEYVEMKRTPEPKLLNDSLEYFTSRFNQYLTREVVPKIDHEIKRPDFRSLFNSTEEKLILNFNYTSTPEIYFNSEDIIQIHGSLKDNDIWLGYGDEHADEYRALENKNDFEYLKFSKSNNYALNDSYNRLIGFMNQAYGQTGKLRGFQAIILGHSCSLSDRTLLKEIFNHEGCRSIRYFYHQNRSQFIRNFVSLSRHFDDKPKLRKKIKEYKEGVDFIE